MIAALAGRWSARRDDGADHRLRTLAARTGEVPTAWGPFLVAGATPGAQSAGGCRALIAGRICDVVGGDSADPAGWLAAGYERAGSEALQGLRGEFLAILWDPRRREGLLARDQLGGRCLHYCPIPGGVAFAEELRDLLPLLAATPGPDRRTVVALAARGVIPIGRSVFDGIHRLPPGRLLRFADDRWSVQSWWRPRYRGVHGGSPEELAERVVAGMDRAVRRCTDGQAVAIMLSGGLDSTTIAASAAQQALDAPGRPVAYSGVFPGRRAADEAQLIDEIVAFLGIRSVRRVVTGGSAVAGALDHLRQWRAPTASPNHFLWGSLLARARADGHRVLLDGEGGDEAFGVTTSLIADRVRRGRLLGAVRLTRRVTGVGPQAGPRVVARMFLRHGLERAAPQAVHRLVSTARNRRDMPAWLAADDVPELLADVDRRAQTSDEGPLWWRDHAYQLTGSRELLDAHGYLRRRAIEVGLDPRHPFMHDVDLVEMALALPPEPRFDPDHDRILLRRGLEGRIPDAVRLRRVKGHFTSLLDDALAGDDGALLRELLGDRGAEVRAYVRPDMLDSDVLRAAAGGTLGARVTLLSQLWRLGNLELWLRSLADPASLEACAQRLPAPAPDEFEVLP
ncbi:MAG: asparagine synthase-related protein [Actinomycetota bacterium]|nr:asparagine synthase-related protein [Actinomycetota bacterium]